MDEFMAGGFESSSSESDRKSLEGKKNAKTKKDKYVYDLFYYTVNFLNIWTPKNIVVIILKFEQHGFTIEKCVQKT